MLRKKQIHKASHAQMLDMSRRLEAKHVVVPSKSRHHYFSYKNQSMSWKGVACLGLLAVAAVAATHQNSNEEETTSKAIKNANAEKAKADAAVCKDSRLPTGNKPNVTLGAKDGIVTPKSCVQNQRSQECNNERNQCVTYTKSDSRVVRGKVIGNARTIMDGLFNDWDEQIIKPFTKMVVKVLNANEIILYKELLQEMATIKYRILQGDIATDINDGFCDEHTAIALKKLINNNLKFGLNARIQVVEHKGIANENNFITGHTYILVDSDIADVAIKNDKDKVAKHLQSMTKGKICDPWNKGTYADYTKDKSGFYDKSAGWLSVKIKTVSLNLEKLKQLPSDIQKFFCEEYKKMGVYIKQKKLCRQFKPKPEVGQASCHEQTEQGQKLAQNCVDKPKA
jgi:hypothetical protein